MEQNPRGKRVLGRPQNNVGNLIKNDQESLCDDSNRKEKTTNRGRMIECEMGLFQKPNNHKKGEGREED